MSGAVPPEAAHPQGPADTRRSAPASRTIAAPETAASGVLLAIDTALGTGAALGVGGRIHEASSDDARGHTEAIGGVIAGLFAAAGVEPAAVTGVVVGVGPGPFTGLRVGIAAAHAFAAGRGVPVLPLQGHEAVALSVLEDGAASSVRIVQDARRRELFVTDFSALDWAGIPVRRADPVLVPRAAHVPAPHEVWPERIPAARLVQLAARRLASGRGFEPDRALYLRAPDVLPPRGPEAGDPVTEAVVRIRPASADDLDAIWALESEVFGAEAWSRESMREELSAAHRVYLALSGEDGAVLGYGGLLAVGAEGDIQTIALAPRVRGSGQGRRLMNALLDAAAERGVREVFLEVRADNPVARGLYASLGFAEIGLRPRYYQPDDVDAVVMRLEIGDRR